MERLAFWPPVDHADLNQDILRRVLGILYKNIKVAVIVKTAGIQEFIFKTPGI